MIGLKYLGKSKRKRENNSLNRTMIGLKSYRMFESQYRMDMS